MKLTYLIIFSSTGSTIHDNMKSVKFANIADQIKFAEWARTGRVSTWLATKENEGRSSNIIFNLI